MDFIFNSFQRHRDVANKADFGEKIANIALGFLRVGFGRSFSVRVLDKKTQLLEFKEKKYSTAVKAAAIALSILLLPLSLILGLAGITAAVLSDSQLEMADLLLQSKQPPLFQKNQTSPNSTQLGVPVLQKKNEMSVQINEFEMSEEKIQVENKISEPLIQNSIPSPVTSGDNILPSSPIHTHSSSAPPLPLHQNQAPTQPLDKAESKPSLQQDSTPPSNNPPTQIKKKNLDPHKKEFINKIQLDVMDLLFRKKWDEASQLVETNANTIGDRETQFLNETIEDYQECEKATDFLNKNEFDSAKLHIKKIKKSFKKDNLLKLAISKLAEAKYYGDAIELLTESFNSDLNEKNAIRSLAKELKLLYKSDLDDNRIQIAKFFIKKGDYALAYQMADQISSPHVKKKALEEISSYPQQNKPIDPLANTLQPPSSLKKSPSTSFSKNSPLSKKPSIADLINKRKFLAVKKRLNKMKKSSAKDDLLNSAIKKMLEDYRIDDAVELLTQNFSSEWKEKAAVDNLASHLKLSKKFNLNDIRIQIANYFIKIEKPVLARLIIDKIPYNPEKQKILNTAHSLEVSIKFRLLAI